MDRVGLLKMVSYGGLVFTIHFAILELLILIDHLYAMLEMLRRWLLANIGKIAVHDDRRSCIVSGGAWAAVFRPSQWR